ncbi:MAG: hypothetical protein RLZZ502_251 [Pseudomonadota bacterium]
MSRSSIRFLSLAVFIFFTAALLMSFGARASGTLSITNLWKAPSNTSDVVSITATGQSISPVTNTSAANTTTPIYVYPGSGTFTYTKDDAPGYAGTLQKYNSYNQCVTTTIIGQPAIVPTYPAGTWTNFPAGSTYTGNWNYVDTSCVMISVRAFMLSTETQVDNVVSNAGGSLNCPSKIEYQMGATCTVSTNSGYTLSSVQDNCADSTGAVFSSSTNGGGNSYTSGTAADLGPTLSSGCKIMAKFTSNPVNGVCAAVPAVANLSASPSLCTTGTVANFGSNTNNYTWTCQGSFGGSNASCSALKLLTVTHTASPSNGGSVSCISITPVAAGSKPLSKGQGPTAKGIAVNSTNFYAGDNVSCTATANSGYVFSNWSGDCSGNTCAFAAISADKNITANFAPMVNGACGTAHGVSVFSAPSSNLCADNSLPNVSSTASNYSWTCAGQNGGSNASCTAPKADATGNLTLGSTAVTGNTVPSSGTGQSASVSFTTTGNSSPSCRFDMSNTGFIASPAAYPVPGSSLPQGMFRLKIIGCTPGFSANVTVVWPLALGNVYTKYGYASLANKTNNIRSFFTPTGLSILGNSVSFTLTDGNLGDDDWAVNGEIIDPNGPVAIAAPPESLPVPSNNRWVLMLLALACLGLGGARILRR